MKRCTRCVLPESYPGIEWDDAGVCNYCLTYRKMRYRGKEELDKLLGSFRNKDGKYDCVVGISGGRDSSYVLYYLVKICNLRVLAYTANHGFVPEAARTNIKKMTDILDVELVVEEHDLLKRCIKHSVASWLRKPSVPMIPMICCGCRLGMFRGLLNCAKENRIPLVVLGAGNTVEGDAFKEAFLRTNPWGRARGVRKSKVLSVLVGLLYEIIRNPFYFLNSFNTVIYVKEYLYYFHSERVQRFFYPDQEILYFYDYIEWDEGEILSTIKGELNWAIPADVTSSWRYDCKLDYLKNYLLRESIGFTEKDEFLSRMIWEDMVTREEALKRLGDENTIPQELVTELIDEIGVNPSDLSVAMRMVRRDMQRKNYPLCQK